MTFQIRREIDSHDQVKNSKGQETYIKQTRRLLLPHDNQLYPFLHNRQCEVISIIFVNTINVTLIIHS